MDLSYIRTFLHVAEVGNFTKAAEDLEYAQSTVTSQIQALEKELGFPLFERMGRKCYLTDAGRDFLTYANDIQYILQKASNLKSQSEDTPISLRIGILESLLFSTVIDLVPLFKAKYTKADLFLRIGTAAELTEMLKQNQLDMIYISSSLNTDNTLSCCYRREERMSFVTSSGHPLASRKKLSLQEIFAYPLIATESSGYCCQTLQNLAANTGLEIHPTITINDIDAISLLLRDERSFSFLPECSVSKHLQNTSLTTLDVDIPIPTYYSQVLLRKSQWISPPMEHLISLIDALKPSKAASIGSGQQQE